MKNCCVIGLGYIGLPTAIVLSNSGYKVLGVDINPQIVTNVNNANPHIEEPDLKEGLLKAIKSGNLIASENPSSAEAFIIAVPTPFKETKDLIPEANLDYLMESIKSISKYLKEK